MNTNTKPRICGECDKTDGKVYAAIPPRVKCAISGEYRGLRDRCNQAAHAAMCEKQGRQPRICQVLGGKDNPLEVGEEWRSTGKDIATYRINEDGHLEFSMPRHDGGPSGNWLTSDIYHLDYFIEHPDHILRQPRFTEDEVAAMRVLAGAGYVVLARDQNGCLCAFACKPIWAEKEWRVSPEDDGAGWDTLPRELFPSLLPGQSLELGAVIGQKENRPG